jgi:Leucine-rich repeat (LRR) protein
MDFTQEIETRIENMIQTDGTTLRLHSLGDLPLELVNRLLTINGAIDRLKILDLSSNGLTNLDAIDLASMQNLITLDLSRNGFTHFPERLEYLPKLETLNLDSNGIRVLRIGRSSLHRLRYLSVRRNGLETIHDDIGLLYLAGSSRSRRQSPL